MNPPPRGHHDPPAGGRMGLVNIMKEKVYAMKKRYKHKYKKKLGWDEELIFFVAKIVGSTALFFMIAIGVDAYRFLH